jgi:hypothetical protein
VLDSPAARSAPDARAPERWVEIPERPPGAEGLRPKTLRSLTTGDEVKARYYWLRGNSGPGRARPGHLQLSFAFAGNLSPLRRRGTRTCGFPPDAEENCTGSGPTRAHRSPFTYAPPSRSSYRSSTACAM